jgi:WbqC-like protein
MKLAIMQPYFLPYLGYFQLMAAVDKFVIYDDVRFIQRGWINRNRILLHGNEHLFVIPLRGASQNQRINQIELLPEAKWREKLLQTLRHAYHRAPKFKSAFPLVYEIINFAEQNLAAYLLNSLRMIKSYLSIETDLVPSSAIYQNQSLKGQARILDICQREKASVYLNLSGGKNLYDPESFRRYGITLRFLESAPIRYQQFDSEFYPSLSIVDMLMFNSREGAKNLLSQFELKP